MDTSFIDHSQIYKIAHTLKASEKQFKIASKRALGSSSSFASSNFKRLLSSNLGLKQKYLKKRFRRSIKYGIDFFSLNLWIGTNAIKAINFNDLQQTPKGIYANKKLVRHAFITTVRKTGRKQVFKRLSKARYPLEVVSVPIDKQAQTVLDKAFNLNLKDKFTKDFKRNIKWLIDTAV